MLQNRTSKLLSGSDVINLKNNSLKDIPSGCKEYAPNNSWLEQKQIQVTLETHHSLVRSERIEKKASLSTAIWLPYVGKAKVTKKSGKVWEVFGHTIDSEDWLLPEEALFLLETNALELFREEVPLSIEEAYTLLLGEHYSLDKYRVYSHLSRKGYRVLRHDKEITLTAYEKNIHLDQINLAEKRCPPPTVVAVKAVDFTNIDEEGGKSKAEGAADEFATQVTEMESTQSEELGKSPICIEDGSKGVKSSADASVEDKPRDSDSTEVELALAEEVEKFPICIDGGSKGEKGSADLSVAGEAKDKESTAMELTSLGETEQSSVYTRSKDEKSLEKGSADLSVADESKDKESTAMELTSLGETEQSSVYTRSKDEKSPAGPSVQCKGKDVESEGVPGIKMVSAEETGQSLICVEDGSEVVNDISVEDKSKDTESPPEDGPNANGDTAPAVVVDISSVDTKEKEASTDVETPDRSNPLADNSLREMVPLKKRVGSSPDLYIVEDEQDDVIEIEDDNDDKEIDTHEVEITQVKMASQMDTVDLMDSEDDDDVVFVCQKSGNTDPSKWRKWFLTIPVFVNSIFPVEIDPNQKPSKLKLIDLFDLGNKTIDTIMKAIPSHDGSANFINAPDLRFIPQDIVPKYAHYRINVQTFDSSIDASDTQSGQSYNTQSSARHPNVDTSLSLSQVVQYGQEPDNFSRNPYGYSFHRTRNTSYRRNSWNPQHNFQNRNNQFQRQNPPFRPNRFIPSDPHKEILGPAIIYKDVINQKENRNGSFDNQNRNYCTSNGSQNFSRPNNFRGPWNNNQNNFQNNFANNQNAQLGGFQQNPNAMGGQLKLALQQACQMQLLAMSLMQNSQALIQNCGAPNMFSNPQMNFNVGNNFNPMNNFNLSNNINPMNITNPFINQFSDDFRGRRPYRRPYMRRGSAGRRRYYNNDRDSPRVTDVTEVVCIDSDEEDRKVKQKPEFKRMLVLGVIADLNSPKRTRFIEIAEAEDVKPVRSVKDESQPSPSKPNAEVTLVKNERLSTKAEPMDTASVSNTEESTNAALDTISLSSDVDEVGSAMKTDPDKSVQSPMSIADESPNSSPMVITDDESSTVPDSNAATFKHTKVPEDDGAETDVVAEGGQNEESSTSMVGEVTNNADGSIAASVTETLSGSWQSYKQGLAEHHADIPSQSKMFSSLLSYEDQRAGVQDVLKSLQIFGPIDETETTEEQIRVSFDVYLPNQPFRKSVRLLPNYRVIVSRSLCFPSVYELNYLKETYRDDVPFLYAVVYDDSIGLYSLHSVTLPTLAENV